MKHKQFNQIYAYTYYLKNIDTEQKYHGVRYANINLGLTPEQDLGKKYFTSGKLQKDFKNNPERYEYRIC